ncbi:Yip1-domain-containing protein [Hesseltinella vesiculosa]|uniref:Yip1-domain-containing protein n=1 Tax=Hesseltinella vesiculosa TaxID=101127 RepID=A0A1X2GJJ9_9FUNG|nr:Yip1-domain-containing protein [Hesseltinella vesiculosa]
MAGKNQYNVLVDMEQAIDYSQPATIESDGLEFQDFSNDTIGKATTTRPPPPTAPAAPTQREQSSPSYSNKPLWSLDYYTRFFDVDTTQVVERCLKSMYPVGDFANDTLEHQPDLYGPFWITTTAVFAVFVCSFMARSVAAYIDNVEYVYDFRDLSYAMIVIYPYTFVNPVVVWASTKYYGCQPSLLEIVDYYGYSMTIWIPISQFRQEKQAREKEARRQDGSAYVNQTPFRYEERYYKSRQPAPDFSMAIDPHQQPCPNQLTPVQLSHDLRQLCPWFGSAVDPHRSDTPGQAFVLNTFPGLVIIPNPFSPSAQRHLIQQCLSEYPKSPNVSNLHTHYRVPDTGLWPLFQQEAQGLRSMDDPSGFVPKKSLVTTADDTQTVPVPAQNSRTLAIPLKACDDKFDPRMKVAKPEPLPSKTVETMPTTQLIRHLRWITLGYHYHWPTRTYHLDRQFPMPEVVARLSHAVVQSIEGVGGQGWTNTYRSKDYRAEAGVINYYQYRDALMGHVDRSELNMDAPLVSVR